MAIINAITDTWNNAGTVFTAIKMTVTNTASASGSKLIDLLVGASSMFSVDKDGLVSTVGTAVSTTANGGTAKAFSYNTSVAYTTTAKLASWANNDIEKAYIQQDGAVVLQSFLSMTIGARGANGWDSDGRSLFVNGGAIRYSYNYSGMLETPDLAPTLVGLGPSHYVKWGSSNNSGAYDAAWGRGAANRIDATTGNGTTYVDVKVRSYLVDATNTAAGTTGAQTINKSAGTVNFAAAATSLVVTNSLVTTSSLVFCAIRTNDATAVIKNVVPAPGSFTINLNAAATAETSVGFIVHN